MLPSDLLITRIKKDRIYPGFAQLDAAEHLELAEELIDVYQNLVGKKKSEINEFLEELEQGLNFKRVRGLRTLLERRCTFTSKFTIEPATARRAVFEVSSSKRVTTKAERTEVIKAVAQNLNVSVDELEHSLWADQESEVILEGFEPLSPEALLKWYNLALAQTLLFKSTGMTIAVKKGKAPEIFRAIKYFGLMYLQEEGAKVRIEGALSLLKLSEKYGTALAKLLPFIVRSESWQIDAEIVIRRDTPRIYHFIMNSQDRNLLFSEELMHEAAKTTFDSSIEKKFCNEFLSLPVAKSWELIREPDVIFTSKGAFIPDFKFIHKELDIETYFEIVGFWTEDYIKRKLAKLRALPFTMLVAIDKNLACFNAAQFDLGLDQPVIQYSKKVPIGDVVRYLATIEREAVTKQVQELREKEIALEGDIIPIKEIARRYSMSQEAVRACLKHPDYVVFKELVVNKKLLRAVKGKLLSIKSYVEARSAIEDTGLKNADEVLTHLGFAVKWKGLDVSAATIGLR